MIKNTDKRLCVDVRSGDTSSVFHRDMLDNPDKFTTESRPWCFDHNDGPTEFFISDADACNAQRAYRLTKGFDPITGEKVKKIKPTSRYQYCKCGECFRKGRWLMMHIAINSPNYPVKSLKDEHREVTAKVFRDMGHKVPE